MKWILCLWRRRHSPVRNPLGGWRCEDCGIVGADLHDAGLLDGGGYVPIMRRIYNRDEGSTVTTSAWEPTAKRGW